jgi:hypothetical protein
VPFIRHARDKRGVECVYVMHGYRTSPAGPQRTRVLYLFRSPSHLKIGRRPLEPEVMEALEHTHPDLTFDWQALQRDSVQVRSDTRDREPRRDRPRGGNGGLSRPTPPARPRAAPPPAPVPEDRSPLAAALGAPEAARLRARFEEMQLRIARRSRSPEERDRLTERLRRLNPDDWTTDDAARSGARIVETEWAAILAELPARRRGRRGGRRRAPGAIMGGDASPDTGSQHASLDEWTRNSGDPDDGDGVGAAAPDTDADIQGED